MAAQDVQNFLSSIRDRWANEVAKGNLAVSQQQANVQQENVEAQTEQAKKDLEQRTKYEQGLIDVHRKQLDLAQQVHKMNAIKQAQEMGQAVQQGQPNVQVQPNSDFSVGKASAGDSTTTFGQMDLGDGTHVSIPMLDPQSAARQEMQRQQMIQAPAIAGKMAEERLKQHGQMAIELEKDARTRKLKEDEFANNIEVANLHGASSRAVASIGAAASRYAADKRAGGDMPAITPEFLTSVADGSLSEKELQKMYPIANQRGQVNRALNMAGVKSLDPKTTDFLDKMSPIISAYPMMEHFNELYKSASWDELMNPLSEKHKVMAKLQDQIHEQLIALQNTIGTSGRLSKQTIDAMKNAEGVTMTPTMGTKNQMAQSTYRSLVNGLMKDRLAGLSPEQRALVLQRRGLQSKITAIVYNVKDSSGKVKQYHIPPEKEKEFLIDHPDAKPEGGGTK